MERIFRRKSFFLGAVVFSLMFVSSSLEAADANSLRAGAAKVDITPKDLTGLWMVWAQPFDGVHDPIYARAVVLDNGVNTAAIISTDLVEFGDTTTLRERIRRELSIPADHIIISASHDHNAPRGGPITPGSSSAQGRPYSPPVYIKQVDDAIVAALKKAKDTMQPARVGVGTGRADVNVNRNGFNGKDWGGADPDGPSDKTVWVVKFETQAGEPIAILMNYAVHSTVGGSQNTRVTGDLAGAAERFVERHYQDKAVALWTMGPAGDQNPKYDLSGPGPGRGRDSVKNKDNIAYETMDALGFIVGAETIQTADKIKQMTSTARIEAGESVFSCDTVPKKPAPANAGPPMFQPNPTFHEVVEYPKSMKIHLNLIQINQIAITGVSGEVFTKIYWHLKKDSPLADTIMVTMSNDRIGYIGDDASYDGPFLNPSVVRGCAENGIVNGLVGLINQHE
jgi:neutral ceramidase